MGQMLATIAALCADQVIEAVEVSVHDALEADLARRGHSLRPSAHPQERTGTTPPCARTRPTLDAPRAQARQGQGTREAIPADTTAHSAESLEAEYHSASSSPPSPIGPRE